MRSSSQSKRKKTTTPRAAVAASVHQAAEKTGIRDIIMSGGVSSSQYMRRIVSEEMEKEDVIVYFDETDLSSDNAVGIALLGGKYIWD